MATGTNTTPALPQARLEQLGYGLVIYPLDLLNAAREPSLATIAICTAEAGMFVVCGFKALVSVAPKAVIFGAVTSDLSVGGWPRITVHCGGSQTGIYISLKFWLEI